MKLLKQFLLILIVSCLGELLKYLIPLPIPASIYGLVLMLLALRLRIIPLEKVREAGNFLIEIMPVMFIPAAVGLLVSGKALKDMWLPLLVIIPVTTILVMVVTGRVAQRIQRMSARNRGCESADTGISAPGIDNNAGDAENSDLKGGDR